MPGESEEEFRNPPCKGNWKTPILAEGPETIAAFFGEPVQGAGGVVVPPATYWEKVQAVLNKYDILLVADEVICGFGRTGTMFGSTTYDIKPDIMVMSKQLSSSYLPASALMINDRVFEPIMEESGRIGTLGHGYTASGHPVVAAVALENLKIIEERDLVGNAARHGRPPAQRARRAGRSSAGWAKCVAFGLIAAVELVTDKANKTAPRDAPARLAHWSTAHLQEAGLISRAMADAVAFCPAAHHHRGRGPTTLLSRFRTGLDKALAELPREALPA